MPQIPRAADLGRTIASGRQAIVREDTSQVGVGEQKIASAIQDYSTRRTNYQISQAKTQFLKSKTEQDNAYDDDRDYDTIPDRYNTAMGDSIQEAAGLIDDQGVRDAFVADAGLQAQQGHERIKDFSRGIERDVQRGFITDGMADLREAALTGGTDVAFATAQELADNAVEMGYITAEEGAKSMQAWQTDTAVAILESMEPEERAEAMSQAFVKHLPTDIRVGLERNIKKELVESRAIDNVDSISHLPVTAAWAEIGDIEDDKVRVATERRFENHLNRNKRIDVAEQGELHRAYFNDVALRGMPVSDIPIEELNKMDPNIVNSYLAAEQNFLRGTDTPTPKLVLDTLNTKYKGGSGSPLEVREYFMEVAHLMSRADFESWSKTTTDSFGEMETDPVFTGNQMINNKVLEINNGDDDAVLSAKYAREFEKWVFEFRNGNEGKDPTGEEQRSKIDQLMLEVPTGMTARIRRGEPRPNEYTLWDEMDSDERGEALSFLQTLDPAAYEQAEILLQESGSFTPRDLAFVFSTLSDSDDRKP